MEIMRRWTGLAAQSALLVLVSGCTGSPYVMRPASGAHVVTNGNGVVAADYAVPPSDPRGDVRVSSFGPERVRVPAEGPEQRAIAVRLVVANRRDDGPWQFDPQVQRAIFPGQSGEAPVLFMSDSAEGGPTLAIPPESQRSIDLFFALPPEGRGTLDHVPRFDVLWQIQTPDGKLTERTAFERLAVQPDAYLWGPGYGPYDWWYEPFWPSLGMYGYGPYIGPVYPHYVPGRFRRR